MSSAPFESDASRAPERVAAVTAALTRWRRELSGVGGPNTLLWYVEQRDGVLDLTTAHPGGVSMLLAGRPTRLSDLVRERAAFAEARTRAAQIRARTHELRTKRGIETGFLTAGMATWEHPGAATQPQAPVLLRSCRLRPVDAGAVDFDVLLGEEVEFNPVLEQYLHSTVGLDLDTVSLADMARLSSGFDPYPVYAALGRLCDGLPGFTVTPRVLVGTFPHGKLAMVGDLAELAEPAHIERLAGHTVLAALAGDGGQVDPSAPEATVVEVPADLDPDPDPAGERLVLDADAAQSGVVEAVLRGRDVAVHAAPGSGTTQTVANIVAALAGEGSTVLLVAEQQAELDDVQDRLSCVGLGSLLFWAAGTLVDHRATLGRVIGMLDEAGTAGERPAPEPATGRSSVEERLRTHRDALRDHVAALHEVRVPWGVTMHQAQGAISSLGLASPAPASRVRIRGAALARLSRERLDELSAELTEAVGVGAWASGQAGDPWYGARVTTDEDAHRAQGIVTRLAGGVFDERAATLDGILTESSLPPATCVNDWRTTLATMSGVRDTLEVFKPEIFDIPLDEHVAATGSRDYRRAQGVDLSAWNRSRVRRLATRLLRPGRPPEDLHAELIRARSQRSAWHALVGAGGRPEISPRLDEAQEAYDELDADLSWLGERLAQSAAGGDLHGIPLREVRVRLAALAARPERLAVLPQVVPVIDDLKAAGMGEVVDDFATRGVLADQVSPEIEHIWWVSIARHVADSDPRYGDHDGSSLRAAAAGFADADEEHLRVAAAATLAEVDGRRAAAVQAGKPQATMLRAEAERRERPIALQAAFEPSSALLLGLAPVWAMSPLTVAATVPPGQWFDVVVVLGAGALTTAASVSALSRARQVVVFGDPHRTGPTGFTASAGAVPAVEDAPARSLLDDLAGLVPVHGLPWAHGYLDERLLALANQTAYSGALTTVPAAHFATPVTLEVVDGRAGVEPGHDTTIDSTDVEVDRVVDLVVEHACAHQDETLAVVTLTERHAERVKAALADAAAMDAEIDVEALRFLDAEAPRPVEVVSMAAAGGLVRDRVILSVGYGKTTHGRVLHRFPALAAPDISRRLTTALSVARRRLTVVSSIAPDELDQERLREGGLLLWQLLTHAAGSEPTPDAVPSDAVPPQAVVSDAILGDLADRLRREGLVVAERFGSGPRTVDLAVADPQSLDGWLVAVEGDGPAYAAWPGTRERDRLWPQELERRGWRHVRVWSTDLYRDPAPEVARVVGIVRDANQAAATDGVLDEPPEAPDRSGLEQPESGDSSADEVAEPPDRPRRRGFRRARSGPPAEPPDTPPAAGAEGTPDQTRDDTDAGWGERGDTGSHDQWLEEQRPPHWD